MTTDTKRAEQTHRWQCIEHNLRAFGQAMYLTVDELIRAIQWMDHQGYGFSMHTLHLRPDAQRYHIKRD